MEAGPVEGLVVAPAWRLVCRLQCSLCSHLSFLLWFMMQVSAALNEGRIEHLPRSVESMIFKHRSVLSLRVNHYPCVSRMNAL